MVEKTETEAQVAAQKAYATAAEAQPAVAQPAVAPSLPAPAPSATTASDEVVAPEVVFPSKAKRKPKADVSIAVPLAVEQAPAPVDKPTPRAALLKGSALKTPSLNAGTVRRASAKKAFKKATPAKPVAQPNLPLKAQVSPKAPKAKTTPQPKAATPTIAAPKNVFQQLKDKTMETTEFTTKLKSAVGEAQIKAKEAFGKGAATFGEYSEFSKGNLDAVVASGKILAGGMQSLGTSMVADGKSAFEILTAEVKELAAVKSPTDFFKLQAAFLRRNFETAVANTTKNSEAVVKLANEVAAPISARVSLAVAKVKQAA